MSTRTLTFRRDMSVADRQAFLEAAAAARCGVRIYADAVQVRTPDGTVHTLAPGDTLELTTPTTED